MNLKNALYVFVSLALTGGIALAQQGTPAPPAVPATPDADTNFTFFVGGGSYIGVYAEDINKENMARYGMREVRGVGITQVMKDSPAEKAGLRKDDVIVKFEGENVTSVRKLNRLVSEVAPDQNARVTINRSGGGDQDITVTVGKRKNMFQGWDGDHFKLKELDKLKGLERFKELEKEFPKGEVWKWEGEPGQRMFMFGNRRRIGVTTTQLTKQLAEYFGIADGKGVLVSSVGDDSPAAKAGIKAGDVITAIDGEKVESAGDLSRAINKKKDGDVSLTIIRNKSQRTVNVTPKDDPSVPMAPQGKTIVIPRIELGEIPEMNIQVPRIELPVIPEVNVVVPGKIKAPKVRVITNGSSQPI